MVWNGHPREWRLSDECHGRSEWNDAAAALRLRWQSFRPSLEIKALIARMMPPHRHLSVEARQLWDQVRKEWMASG
jgi:hypothetical protein